MGHPRISSTTLLPLLVMAALPLTACDGAEASTATAVRQVLPAGSVAQVELAPVQETDAAFLRFVNTHVYEIKSEDVLREVLRQPEVGQTTLIQSNLTEEGTDTNAALRDLRQALTVAAVRDTNLIEIHVSAKDRVGAATVANAIADVYLKRVKLLERVRHSALNELFTAWRVGLEKDIDEATKDRDKLMDDLARQPEVELSYEFFARKYLEQADAVAMLEMGVAADAQKKDAELEKRNEERLSVAKARLAKRQEQLDSSRRAWRKMLVKQQEADAVDRKLERLRAEKQRLGEALARMDWTMRRPDTLRVRLQSQARTPSR
jgi:hypothetical protein